MSTLTFNNLNVSNCSQFDFLGTNLPSLICSVMFYVLLYLGIEGLNNFSTLWIQTSLNITYHIIHLYSTKMYTCNLPSVHICWALTPFRKSSQMCWFISEKIYNYNEWSSCLINSISFQLKCNDSSSKHVCQFMKGLWGS